ncbi:hypothetical protein [Gorillibacterium massiliense]|uniref:hypothetical protein n=1 Tax=Gorillibacterium massiliense TaxID=1280390 RepID=UPI0004BB196F|nr:hypothetical protein [Gorillibacterium massiliense]
MDFETAYVAFLQHHLSLRSGERLGRLQRGHRHAEKLLLQNVIWPVLGSLEHLHPEYEVKDWNRKSQFLDWAYLPSFGRFDIECDGYQSHVKDMDRDQFSYSLNRDTYLTATGWTVVHFSYDDVKDRPDICRMLLQMLLAPFFTHPRDNTLLSPNEKEILRLALSLSRPIRPKDVSEHFQIDYRTARKRLLGLVDRDMLKPIVRNKYTCSFVLAEHFSHKWLL